jgi:hypothetical protein
MKSLIAKIRHGFRTQGPLYLFRAVRNEIAHPRLLPTRYVRSALIAARGAFRRPVSGDQAWSDGSLQFFYDLSTSPITFDFTSYLAAAEVERRLRGLETINVIFVLGPLDGVRRELPDYDAAVDRSARLWRFRNILVPMLSFLPTVAGYAVCSTKEQAEALMASDPARLYPGDYRVFLPRQPAKRIVHEHARAGIPIWPMLYATERGRRLVAEFLEREAKGRRPVVITLRNYAFTPTRNSRNEDWIAFADGLDQSIYAPIFVHDSETAMGHPPGDFSRHIVCEAASWNLEIRMALYEAAWLNMALMHGPLELCWYNESARYLLFITVGTAAVTTADAMIENGHRIGVDLDFAKPWQRFAWEPDSLSALQRNFTAMEARLAGESRSGPAHRHKP